MYKILMFCLALSTSTTVSAADSLARLQAFRAIDEPFSLAFEQSLLTEDGQAVETQSGRLQILPPNRFVWRYQQPFVAEFGSNGVLVWHWDPELAQVTVRDADQVVADTPLGILLDDNVDWPVQAEGEQWLRWEPQGEQSMFTQLRVRMGAQVPAEIELVDALGQTTRVRLTDLQIPDAKVDPRFPQVGPETTVVDQRAAP
nr:outer-membrane lipoprotein carrier protein LolA [Oceanococcus sp. HetDA_MAG_MS8]